MLDLVKAGFLRNLWRFKMNSFNYKIKTLIAIFLFSLSSLVLASPCEDSFSSKKTVQRQGSRKPILSERLIRETRPENTSFDKLRQAVLNLDYDYIIALEDHSQFSISELESAIELINKMHKTKPWTKKAETIEYHLHLLLHKKEFSRSVMVGIKTAMIGLITAGTILTTWDVSDHYLNPKPYNPHIIPVFSEPIIEGIDWSRELLNGEQQETSPYWWYEK